MGYCQARLATQKTNERCFDAIISNQGRALEINPFRWRDLAATSQRFACAIGLKNRNTGQVPRAKEIHAVWHQASLIHPGILACTFLRRLQSSALDVSRQRDI